MVKHAQLLVVSFTIICMAAIAHGTSLQYHEVHCNSVLMGMSTCVPYIINGSRLAKPKAFCCHGFKKIVTEHPNCICEALKNVKSIPIPIDLSRALSLPSVCNATANLPCSLFPPSGHSPAPAPSGYDYSPYPGKSLPPSPGDHHGSPPPSSPGDGDKSPHPPSRKSSPSHAPALAPAHGPATSGATALSQSSPVLVLFLAAVALKQHI